MNMFNGETIISAGKTEDGSIEIIRRYQSLVCLGNGKPVPDKIIKEIYSIVDGKIECFAKIEGKHTPSYFAPEKIEF